MSCERTDCFLFGVWYLLCQTLNDNSTWDLTLTELGLSQTFYNRKKKISKEETSSARSCSFTHSYYCGQNYWHIGTLGRAQQNSCNSKEIVSKIENTSEERSALFQNKEQTFSLSMQSTKIMCWFLKCCPFNSCSMLLFPGIQIQFHLRD